MHVKEYLRQIYTEQYVLQLKSYKEALFLRVKI